MDKTLQSRKQQLVHDAIYDAALDLFVAKGFEDTTVDEVAQAAGVSRRSFFRYFASKDDLMAQNVVNYGIALSEAVAACPAESTPLEVMRETVLSVSKYITAQPRVREAIGVSQRSVSARQANLSRLYDVEDTVQAAFAVRLKGTSKGEMRARLLAKLTVSIMSVAILSWFGGEYQDLSVAAKQTFANLTRLFGEAAAATPDRDEAQLAGRR